MRDLNERLDEMEEKVRSPKLRQSSGRANEVNYWVFDYPPEKELVVRERIKYMQNKNSKGGVDFDLVVFDLYDIIIDFLEKNDFMEECYKFEQKKGLERISAPGNADKKEIAAPTASGVPWWVPYFSLLSST